MGCGCSRALIPFGRIPKEPSFNELFLDTPRELDRISIPSDNGLEGQAVDETIGRVNHVIDMDEFDAEDQAAKRAVTDEIEQLAEKIQISGDIEDSPVLAGLYSRADNRDDLECTMDCKDCRSGNPVLEVTPTKAQFTRNDSLITQQNESFAFKELRHSRLEGSRSPLHPPVITEAPRCPLIKTQSAFSSFEDLSIEAKSLQSELRKTDSIMIHPVESAATDSTIIDYTSHYLSTATSNANVALAGESSESLHKAIVPFIHSVLSISVCQVTGGSDSLLSIEESIRDLYHYQDNPYTSSYYNEDWSNAATDSKSMLSGSTNANDNYGGKMKGNLNMNKLVGQNPVVKLML